jgi:hypothetical protein
MQSQVSGLAIGGRLLEAAQSAPTVGHARATVLVTVYAEAAVELGLIVASCFDNAVKSGSLLTVPSLTDTIPRYQLAVIG